MVIYADVVFFVNFVFDAVILLALYKFQSRKIRPFRLLAAAFLGGGLGVAVLIPYLQPLLSAAARFVLPFVMSAICFVPCSFKTVLVGGIYIFSLSFLFAGMMGFLGTGAVFGVLLTIPVILCVGKIRKNFGKKYRKTVLTYNGKKVATEGFLDSGNLLSYKGIPVVLAKNKIFEELFGEGFCISSISEWIDIEDLRYVSYSSLGKDGVIPGVLIDSASVDGKVFEEVILGHLGENFSEQVILASVMV